MMNFSSQKHERKSIRMRGYDYAQPGAYFVTTVTAGRDCIFGEIIHDEMQLSEIGKMVLECWQAVPVHFTNVELGAFVVMPNHVHGVIILHDGIICRGGVTPPLQTRQTPSQQDMGGETPPGRISRPTLGQVVAYFKYQSTKQVNHIFDSPGVRLWQRNYYEHIVRNDEEHQRIHLYIDANPANWMDDEENPEFFL